MYIFKNTLTHVNQHFLDGYFLQVLNLFMCRKYKIIFVVKNEEQSFTLQKSVGNFIAQQKVKKSQLCSKKCRNFTLQKNAEDITPQQKVESILWQKLEKSSFCGRNGEQAQFVTSSLGLWTQRLRTNQQWQNGTLEPILHSARPNFLLRKSLD